MGIFDLFKKYAKKQNQPKSLEEQTIEDFERPVEKRHKVLDEILLPFDITNMKYYYSSTQKDLSFSDIYYFKEQQKTRLENYLLAINLVLNEFHKSNSQFKAIIFDKDRIRYEADYYGSNGTTFLYHPYTKTGKVSKYTSSVNIIFDDKIDNYNRVEIHFDKMKNPLKSQVFYRDKNFYQYTISVENNKLQVSKIYKSIEGIKKLLFEIKKN